MLNYTLKLLTYEEQKQAGEYSGSERLDKNYIEIILPSLIAVGYVQFYINFVMENGNLDPGTNATHISLCEITMHGNF
jgi:hypothetical protein